MTTGERLAILDVADANFDHASMILPAGGCFHVHDHIAPPLAPHFRQVFLPQGDATDVIQDKPRIALAEALDQNARYGSIRRMN